MQISELAFLVVEDDDFQRNALVKMLERVPAKCVYAAANGQLALDLLLNMEEPVDIIVSDLRMPVMDGMELIRHVGEKGYRTSVLITSALERSLLTTVEKMTRAYGIQLLGAMEKPLTLRGLKAVIEKHTPTASPDERPHLADPVFTIDEILEGLENKQFEAFFQPKVEIASGEIIGAEALARWLHPQQGIVAPEAFIKILEDHGEIDQLMWLMLRKATQFCIACREAGDDITVAVNLSLKSLGDVELADRVTEVVTALNVKPQQIVLEVTESTASGGGGELENLSRLRMKGFGLSIDDYGTGYSSMQQLTRIPFSEVKIDRAFVTDAGSNDALKTILRSSLELARQLNISSVAEGVETQKDWDLLQELGCDIAQGYYIARPMAGDAYIKWVDDVGRDPMTVVKRRRRWRS